MIEEAKQAVSNFNKIGQSKNAMIGVGVFLVLVLVFFGSASVYNLVYKNKIFPGVYVGSHHLGGLTNLEAKDFMENFNNRMAKESLDFSFIKVDKVSNFKLSPVSADDSSVEMVKINSESSAGKLVSVGRSGNFFTNLWQPLYIRLFSQRVVSADVVVEDRFVSSLKDYMSDFSDKPRNANI